MTAQDFSLDDRPGEESAAESLDLAANERRLVETALRRHAGNISHAAGALGITRAALYRRIRKHGL